MNEGENRLSRLRYALRYILVHPDMSPSIMAKEWKISIDEAIEICSKNFGTTVIEMGISSGEDFDHYEKEVFKKLMKLKNAKK